MEDIRDVPSKVSVYGTKGAKTYAPKVSTQVSYFVGVVKWQQHMGINSILNSAITIVER